MNIPEHELWTRTEFLDARKRQTEAFKNQPREEFWGEVIVVDAGEEIICDTCNDLIETPYVHLVDYGKRVNCDRCYERSKK